MKGNAAHRLAMSEAILSLIEAKRRETGDPNLGSAIESAVLESTIRELEQDIFDNPGAMEPWLVRLRRGAA